MAASPRSRRSPQGAGPAVEDAALRRTLAAVGLAAWELELRGGVVRWSETFAALHGLPATASAGSLAALLAVIHPADRARVEQTFSQDTTAHTPFDLAYRVVAVGGERWIRSRGAVERD